MHARKKLLHEKGVTDLQGSAGPLPGPIERVIGHYGEEEFWYCYSCGAKNPRKFAVCGACGKDLLIRLTVEPTGIKHSATNLTSDNQPLSHKLDTGEPEKFNLNARTITKTFLHGLLFVILFAALAIAWIFAMLFLVPIGSLIGVAIGVVLFILGIGKINEVLGRLLWDISANTGLWSLLVHGLVLGVILFVVGLITDFLPNLLYPGTATYIITLVINSFIDGVVGRKVALWFRD